MKKFFTIFILLISIVFFAQEGVAFQQLTFNQLLDKAKKENKLLFIDAMADWCGPCKMMDKNVFPKKSVADFYNQNFVNAQFDMEKGEGREIAAKYGVRSYPTYLFINGDGQLITQNSGYMPESTFLELGKEANAALKNIGSMRERFDKGEKDPDFLINIIKLHSKSDVAFAKLASERYFLNKKNKDFTKDEVGYLLFCVSSVDDANYKIFQENREALDKHFPPQSFVTFDNQLKIKKIAETSIDANKKEVNDRYFLEKAIPLIGENDAEKFLNSLKLNYYEETNNFTLYEKTALVYFKDPDLFDSAELLKAATIFLEKAQSKTSLNAATYWAEKAVMRTETPENTYLLAKLYQKNGKIAEAIMFAESAININKKLGTDASLPEKLLSELK